MTYIEAQEILEKRGFGKNTTIIQKMVYEGWLAPNIYGGYEACRDWDDEMTDADFRAVCRVYPFLADFAK